MERLADEALDRAGVELDPRGFLIGFPVDGSDAVLIEPERNAFDVEPLAGLLGRADALFEEQRRTTCPASCPEARSVAAGVPHAADEEWHPEHYLTALREVLARHGRP